VPGGLKRVARAESVMAMHCSQWKTKSISVVSLREMHAWTAAVMPCSEAQLGPRHSTRIVYCFTTSSLLLRWVCLFVCSFDYLRNYMAEFHEILPVADVIHWRKSISSNGKGK